MCRCEIGRDGPVGDESFPSSFTKPKHERNYIIFLRKKSDNQLGSVRNNWLHHWKQTNLTKLSAKQSIFRNSTPSLIIILLKVNTHHF